MSEVNNANQTKKYNLVTKGNEYLDFFYYIRTIRKQKLLIVLVTFAFLTLGFLYSIYAQPIYNASAKIKADPVQPNASASDQYMMNSLIYLFYETQYEIIQSRKVSERVVDKLGLVEKYKSDLKESSNEQVSFFEDLSNKFFGKEHGKEDLEYSDKEIRDLLADSIRYKLKVDGGTQSQIINISFESENPEYAAKIVNEVSDAYVAFGLQTRLDSIEDTSSWLGEQLTKLKKRLQTSELELKNFSERTGMVDTAQQERIASAQLTSLNNELIRAQTRLSEAEELYLQFQNISEASYASLGPVLQSNSVRELAKEVSNLSIKVNELNERYGPKHPKMISAITELDASERNLKKEVDKIVKNIEKEYRLAQTQVDNIAEIIKKTKDEVQSYQGDSFELTRLEREVSNNRLVYESFLSKLMETDISGNYDGTNVSVIDPAIVPKAPVKPRKLLIIVASILAGLFAGISLAVLRETLSNTFTTPEHLEQSLNIPSLGIVPMIKKSKSVTAPELQYFTDNRSTFSESINSIRSSVLFSNIDSKPKTIVVTSSTGSEGKSTLSINLAAAFSQIGKTLLLELDLRKPTISKKLELSNKVGLVDFMQGNTDKLNVQKYKDSDQLSILLCGAIPSNPTEIVSSEKFSKVLEKLKDNFEYIVIDSPPVMPVTDSTILSSKVDATVLAVRADQTKDKMAIETVNRLFRADANIVGTVLTQASEAKMSYYGDHYYRDEYYGISS